MKEENQPIKVECFMQLSESRREPIGFVLIPLRTIPFWNSRKMGMMKPHWYKLHGVAQDNKTPKPELLLGVTIGDKDVLEEHEKLVTFARHPFTRVTIGLTAMDFAFNCYSENLWYLCQIVTYVSWLKRIKIQISLFSWCPRSMILIIWSLTLTF